MPLAAMQATGGRAGEQTRSRRDLNGAGSRLNALLTRTVLDGRSSRSCGLCLEKGRCCEARVRSDLRLDEK